MYSSLNTSKNIDEHDKQLYLEEYYVKTIGARPPISCHESPIGQNIVIPNTSHFRENRPDHDQKNCRQHDSSYYQPQPGLQNHRQKYCNDRIIQQAYYKQDYDRDKGVSHGIICSGIPTSKKSNTNYSIEKGF